MHEWINKIVKGNSMELVDRLPDKLINTTITSPPYFALRNYGHEDQIGAERYTDDYIRKLVKIFAGIHRATRDDGTLWLNLGDTYNGYHGNTKEGKSFSATNQHARQIKESGYGIADVQLKPKDLMGIPWRVAFALQGFAVVPMYKMSYWADILKKSRETNDWELVLFVENVLRSMDFLSELQKQGWYLRQDIIWYKPNPMPESVTDRCTKSHEYIFLLSKSEKYYYDYQSIMKECITNDNRLSGVERNRVMAYNSKENNNPEAYLKKSWNGSTFDHGKTGEMMKTHGGRKSGNIERKPASERGVPAGKGKNQAGSVPWEGEKANKRSVWSEDDQTVWQWLFNQFPDEVIVPIYNEYLQQSGIQNDVWKINTQSFKDAHFATFPQNLIVDCIKAGCPENGIVLDPFMGGGTTAVVARKLNRNYIGFELNQDYINIADKRLLNDVGGLFL